MDKIIQLRNPFPFQGTRSIEGTRINPLPGSRTLYLPTLMLDPVGQTLNLIRKYLLRFPSNRQGQVVALSGKHGTGKTHTILYVIDVIERVTEGKELGSTPGLTAPHQIYVKAEGPEFVKLYQEAVALVPFDLLRDLSLRFLGLMATEQLQVNPGSSTSVVEVDDRLRSDPNQVFELFRQYQVEAGAAEERRTLEVERVAGGMRDFYHALSYLLSSELATTAYDWLLGRPVPTDAMRQIGVVEPITQPAVAKWALQLIVTLFSRTGKPLIIYIDQYEKLVLDENDKIIRQNAGLIHSLVEFIPRENGMLLLSGNENAWNALPSDLKQRFSGNLVEFPVLKLEEAKSLIRLYLTPTDKQYEPNRADPDIVQFDDAAVKEIMRFSAGNIRRFLQICAQAWEVAGPTVTGINEEMVQEAVKLHFATAYFDERSVVDEIKQMLITYDFTFKGQTVVAGQEVDFAVLGLDGTPRLIIDVKEAFFHYDEALRALESLALRSQLVQQQIPAQYVLIVLGYVSPEIVLRVREFVHELVIYDPNTFHELFRPILERVTILISESHSAQRREQLESELTALRSALEKIADARALDTGIIEQRITSLLERQSADRTEERRQLAREAWASERRQIEERIREIRKARLSAEVEEIGRLAHKVEADGDKRIRLLGITTSLYFVMTGVLLIYRRGLAAITLYPEGLMLLLLGLILAAASFMLPEVLRIGLFSKRRELRSAVTSLEELERAARAHIGRYPAAWKQLLRSRYPQERYAAALTDDKSLSVKELLSLLTNEPVSAVRRVIAKRVGRQISDSSRYHNVDADLEVVFSENSKVMEIGYAVEFVAKNISTPFGLVPGYIKTLIGLSGNATAITGNPGLGYELACAITRKDVPTSAIQQVLAKAFKEGPDRCAWPDKLPFHSQQIEEALAELSPFDTGGLGTLDELLNIKKVDQMYLFFRHLAFLFDRDLLRAH